MIMKNMHYLTLMVIWVLIPLRTHAQQEPQYTQYQYNTMTINPGYTGTSGHPQLIALYRNQWAGIEGAPRTFSLGLDSPLKLFSGIGLSIVRDELGPAQETYFDVNFSHSLLLNAKGHRLALGIKAGGKHFSLDWARGIYRDPDVLFNENIKGEFLPSLGAGLYYYTDNAYIGLSTPNALYNKRYKDIEEAVGKDRTHIYLIAGYVFQLNPSIKFKPTSLIKYVDGSPIIADGSINFLFNDAISIGANYRWDDSISALIGFYLSRRWIIGYAYDYSISDISNYNSGSHEIFVKFNLNIKNLRIKSPRFF